MEGTKPGASGLVGRTFGEFIVREQLGSGGFGSVYRAEQPALAREAVIKVLHKRLLGSETQVQRFLREARLASRLDHPYAAHTYAFGAEPDGVLWIAMEYVRGTPLDRLLQAQGPIQLERFVPLLERICEVVHTAHEQGIVHRDLKPGNVMVLSRAGRLLPKLLDFGIAKLDDGTPAPPPAASPRLTEPPPPRTAGALTRPSPAGALDVTAADDLAAGDAGTLPGEPTNRTLSDSDMRSSGRRLASTDSGAFGRLTNVGAVMGSPLYMAPEQWSDAAAVDARTDIYALGVLCYECLTGEPPFSGANHMQIALAHAKQQPPPLSADFPRELGAVLARALAKAPSERHQTALELAAAFRAASGIADEPALLPRLDDAQRTASMTRAPRPLARALELLDGARNAHQARDALWQVVHAAVRLVGVAALACHSHVGTDRGATDPDLAESLRALRGRALSDAGWFDLARALVLPFADLRDAHPIPELVALLDRRRAPSALAALVALRAGAEQAGAGSDDRVRELLERALPTLARALDELSFFENYPLVVPLEDGPGGSPEDICRDDQPRKVGLAEDWMGLRRADRPRHMRTSRRAVVGHPVLLDADGAPSVSLWPFAQVHEPSPGAPRELFFFEGKGRRGARLVALPHGFEHEDEELWDVLGTMLRDSGESPGRLAADEAGPFPGLAAFTATDAKSFFGRERETEAFLNRLRVTPFLVVVGPSGAGKSSFVQAGVVPSLPEGWRALTVRPGSAPLVALATRLVSAGLDTVDLGQELAEHPGALGSVLRRFAGKHGGSVVLVVDQLEELFTLCEDERERAIFADALVRAARSPDDPVRIVATLRDDFLLLAEAVPAFRSRLGPSLQLLTTPAPPDLRRILTMPIRQAGYEFDDPGLPDEMVEEVASAPGALALLSFTASKLWELRDRRFRQIAHKAYRSLGGVGGALAQHAEATLQAMSAEEQRLVREVFRHGVTSEGTRAVLTRDELDQVLGGHAHAAAVIEKLIAARLLVTSESEGDNERVEIIHEALLGAWPRLVGWRREDAEGSRLRDQLRAAARQWDERGRPGGLLWRDEALLDYRRWRALDAGNLTELETAFTDASERAEARGRRRRHIAAGVGLAALMAAIAVLIWMNGRTARQRAEAVDARRSAEENVLRLQVEHGREALLARDYARAAAYLAHAFERGVDSPALRFMLTQAMRPLRLRPTVLEHGEKLEWVAFSPDGTRVVTCGDAKRAVVWTVEGERLLELDMGGDTIARSEFSPDGRVILGAGNEGTVALWSAADGAVIARHNVHRYTIWSAHFSPDGTRFATAGSDRLVVVWSAMTGEPLATLRGHQDGVLDVAWAPDGQRLATAGIDGTARIWDPARGTLLYTLTGSRAELARAVAVSPDGTSVAAGIGRIIHVWRVADGSMQQILPGHAGPVSSLAFAADGRLVSASWDATAKVWDTGSGRLLASLDGHKGKVRSASWSPDARRILTTSDDGSGRLWDSRGALLAILSGHTSDVLGGAIDPRGFHAATASTDGTARVWPLDVDTAVSVATGHGELVHSVQFSEDGKRFVTTSRDRTARLWDARRTIELARMETRSPTATAAIAGPGLAVVIADDNQLAFYGPDGKRRTPLDLSFRIESLAVAPGGGRLLVVSRLGDLALIDMSSRHVRMLDVGGGVTFARFGAGGTRVAAAHSDGRVDIWDVASGELILRLEGHARAAARVQFCAGSSRLMSVGHDGAIKLWDTSTGALVRSFVLRPGYFSPEPSPDCSFVAAGGDGYAMVILDAVDGRLLDHVEVRAGEAIMVTMSPDGHQLAATDGDVAWVWNVPPAEVASLVELARCALPYRVEGASLVIAHPDPGCDVGAQ